MNTAWTMRVLFMETMPILFQVRPKSPLSTGTSASSETSSWLAADTAASKDRGRVQSRTVGRAGHCDTAIRRPNTVHGEGDVRVVRAVEEVS